MTTTVPYLLVGTDAEGDRWEWDCMTLDYAIWLGLYCMNPDTADKNGPPWQSFEVWGNHPDWRVVVRC